MIAYKIFRNINGELYSIFVNKNTIGREFSIEYKINKKNYSPNWLSKKGYHPLVFKDFDKCKNYFDDIVDEFEPILEIWSCKIEKLLKINKPFLFINSLKNFEVKIAEESDFYDGDDEDILKWCKENNKLEFLDGSYFAKYVIPFKKICWRNGD